jgi:hypothetical protein
MQRYDNGWAGKLGPPLAFKLGLNPTEIILPGYF